MSPSLDDKRRRAGDRAAALGTPSRDQGKLDGLDIPTAKAGASTNRCFVLRLPRVEFHRSAGRHGVTRAAISHALEHPLAEFEIDDDPSKILVLGPGSNGNLLEVVVLLLDGDRLLVIHAMPLRSRYHHLLPEGDPNA